MARLTRLMRLTRVAQHTLRLATAAATAVAGLAQAAPAPSAEPLNDPMRPPPALQPSAPAASGAAPALGAGDVMPVLQGTRRNQQGTWLALLDGRWRAVGERHGEAVVSSVRATEVQLSLGSQRVTVKLQATAPQANGMTTGSKQERP